MVPMGSEIRKIFSTIGVILCQVIIYSKYSSFC
jgi:hypothetical protein